MPGAVHRRVAGFWSIQERDSRKCEAVSAPVALQSKIRARVRASEPHTLPPNPLWAALEDGPKASYLDRRRVLLRFASKTSNPGDLNLSLRELSLSRAVALDTRRPPVNAGPRRFQFFTALAAPPHSSLCHPGRSPAGAESRDRRKRRRRARSRISWCAPFRDDTLEEHPSVRARFALAL